eukprot:364124-Chlamydomonas_euryale.AAC.1
MLPHTVYRMLALRTRTQRALQSLLHLLLPDRTRRRVAACKHLLSALLNLLGHRLEHPPVVRSNAGRRRQLLLEGTRSDVGLFSNWVAFITAAATAAAAQRRFRSCCRPRMYRLRLYRLRLGRLRLRLYHLRVCVCLLFKGAQQASQLVGTLFAQNVAPTSAAAAATVSFKRM